jgi:6-pyruvoyl-tetrahydropterin synthase
VGQEIGGPEVRTWWWSITVRSQFVALHRWAAAPEPVAFLRNWHRHLFLVAVELEVKHEDRELEFFLVKGALEEFLRREFEGKYLEKSCEGFAEEILHYLETLYPGRVLAVSVEEDGENGATIHVRRE